MGRRFNPTRVAAWSIVLCPGVMVDVRGTKPLVSAQTAKRCSNAVGRSVVSTMEIREWRGRRFCR